MASIWSGIGNLLGLTGDSTNPYANQPPQQLDKSAFGATYTDQFAVDPATGKLRPQTKFVNPNYTQDFTQGLEVNRQMIGQTQAPQIGQAGINAAAQAAQPGIQNQNAYIQSLQAAANGMGGPSAAEAQLGMARQGAINDQASLAGSAQGGVYARQTAMDQAQRQDAQINSNAGYQASILRAQEQQAARQQLGQAIQEQRVNALQAQGMSQQQALAQANLEAGQRGLNQQGQFGYLGAQLGIMSQQQQAQMRYEEDQANMQAAARQQAAAAWEADQARSAQLGGGLLNSAGSITAAASSGGKRNGS